MKSEGTRQQSRNIIKATHSRLAKVGSDRISDESLIETVSDLHPDTLTDPEFSDPPIVTSSQPQSIDEIRRNKVEKVKYNQGYT